MTAELVPAHPGTGDERIGELTAQWLTTRKSQHTREAYRRDLASWLNWCRSVDLHPLEAWPGDILAWLTYLATGDPARNKAPEAGNTQDRRLGAVSSWYQWLVRHTVAHRNPAHIGTHERPVRAPRRAPALSDKQTEDLLAAADAYPNPRAAAIVWLMLTTGIRVGELIAANVGDIGQDRGVAVLHVRGKGGKTRMAEIEPSTYVRLHAYIGVRRDADLRPVPAAQAGATSGNDRPLIATANGKRIDRKEVRLLLKRLAATAGLPDDLADRLTPHSTRATFITTSLEDGVPIRDVQYAAGHVSPVTTEAYDRSRWSPDRSPSRRVARRFRTDRLDARRDALLSGEEPE